MPTGTANRQSVPTGTANRQPVTTGSGSWHGEFRKPCRPAQAFVAPPARHYLVFNRAKKIGALATEAAGRHLPMATTIIPQAAHTKIEENHHLFTSLANHLLPSCLVIRHAFQHVTF